MIKRFINNLISHVAPWSKKYWVTESILIMCLFYLLYNHIATLSDLLRSFFIFSCFVIYKFILIHASNDDNLKIIQMDKKWKHKLLVYVDEKVLRGNSFRTKIFYYILYYFPTNWPFLIIMWLAVKWGKLRLLLNSSKDVIARTYFNADWSNYKSPLNYKIATIFKTYVYDVFFKIFYISLYVKINLISANWSDFLRYRFFGSIFALVLIYNNLHFITWLFKTPLVGFITKIIVVVSLVYIFLFFFTSIVILKGIKQFDLQIKNNQNSNDDSQPITINVYDTRCKLTLQSLYYIVEHSIMAAYYKTKDYLIFMSLAEDFEFYINVYYKNFLLKNLMPQNIRMPSNLVMLGRISADKHESRKLHSDFIYFFFEDEKNKIAVNENGSVLLGRLTNVDAVWIFEKNYRPSAFMYAHSFDDKSFIKDKLINYELFKVLYGEQLVEEHFNDELQEFESIWFIAVVMNFMFERHFNIKNVLSNVANNVQFGGFIHSKDDFNYAKFLDVCDFYVYINSFMLHTLDYSIYFSSNLYLHIEIMYSDLQRYRNEYNNDVNKFIKYWTDQPNNWDIQHPLMQMQIQIFLKSYPALDTRYTSLNIKINQFINTNLRKDGIQSSEVLDIIKDLQNKHKQIYFKHSKRLSKSADFVRDFKILPQWHYFDKKNKDMFL